MFALQVQFLVFSRRSTIEFTISSWNDRVFFNHWPWKVSDRNGKARKRIYIYEYKLPYIWAVKGNLVQEQRSKTYNNPKKQAKNAKNKTKMKPRNKIHNTNKETNKLNRLRVLALMLPSPPITLNTSVSPHCNMKANQEITLTTIWPLHSIFPIFHSLLFHTLTQVSN